MEKTTNKTISRILGVAAILGMTTGAIATQKKLLANDPNGTGAATSSGSVKKNENLTLNEKDTKALRAEMSKETVKDEMFNFGGTIDEIKARSLEETHLEPPVSPTFLN